MLGALVFQWMRESEREARRIDRALDRAEALEAAAAGPDGSVRSASAHEAETHR
jgi:putative copper resistance protein D